MITKKKKRQLESLISCLSSEVLGYRILEVTNNKYVMTSKAGVVWMHDNRPVTLTMMGFRVVTECHDVFSEINHRDPQYIKYMPNIEKLNNVLDGDYDALEDIPDIA